ncbi:MAG TPA: hypothetical protein VMD78_15670 [Candidatus Baltobacteraceae bacterium]|nr:hypothetical protein [Candidatus Baltobacteraceae bacterium]
MKTKAIRLVVGAVLATAFTMGAARITLGDVNDDCHRKLEADRARIDRDAAKYGNDSPKVAHDVGRMDSDRNWCRDHHADWDHTRFDVGIYIKH